MLGTNVSAPTATVNGPTTVCSYPKGNNPSAVTIFYQTGSNYSHFHADKFAFEAGYTMQDVTGVGDEAYIATRATGSSIDSPVITMFAARKGSIEVRITALTRFTSQSQDPFQSLMVQILAHLP